jgi:signal peptidase II
VKKSLPKYLFMLFLMFGGVALDFQSKQWAEQELKGRPAISVVSCFLDVRYTQNRGMVFGMFNGRMHRIASMALLTFRILILIGLTLFIGNNRTQPLLPLAPFALFWTGALGNLIDPFVYGYVVDFLHIKIGGIIDWPFVFNLADAYITTGFGLFLFIGLTHRKNPVYRTFGF